MFTCCTSGSTHSRYLYQFHVRVHEIRFSQNDYFLPNSLYEIYEAHKHRFRRIRSGMCINNIDELSRLRIEQTVSFSTYLYLKDNCDESKDPDDVGKFCSKYRRLVIQQHTKMQNNTLMRDIGYIELGLHQFVQQKSPLHLEYDLYDPDQGAQAVIRLSISFSDRDRDNQLFAFGRFTRFFCCSPQKSNNKSKFGALELNDDLMVSDEENTYVEDVVVGGEARTLQNIGASTSTYGGMGNIPERNVFSVSDYDFNAQGKPKQHDYSSYLQCKSDSSYEMNRICQSSSMDEKTDDYNNQRNDYLYRCDSVAKLCLRKDDELNSLDESDESDDFVFNKSEEVVRKKSYAHIVPPLPIRLCSTSDSDNEHEEVVENFCEESEPQTQILHSTQSEKQLEENFSAGRPLPPTPSALIDESPISDASIPLDLLDGFSPTHVMTLNFSLSDESLDSNHSLSYSRSNIPSLVKKVPPPRFGEELQVQVLDSTSTTKEDDVEINRPRSTGAAIALAGEENHEIIANVDAGRWQWSDNNIEIQGEKSTVSSPLPRKLSIRVPSGRLSFQLPPSSVVTVVLDKNESTETNADERVPKKSDLTAFGMMPIDNVAKCDSSSAAMPGGGEIAEEGDTDFGVTLDEMYD